MMLMAKCAADSPKTLLWDKIKQSNTFLSRISFPDFLPLLEILIITVKASLFPLKGTIFINLSISL